MAKQFAILTDDEIAHTIAQIESYGNPNRRTAWRALFLLLTNLALRVSEALLLHWKDVDFFRKEVTVRTLKQRELTYDTLPLNQRTIDALVACKNSAKPDDLIFPGISRRYAYNVWQRLLHLAMVRPIKLHALRHSAITRWLEQTGDIPFTQAMARHRDLASTAQYARCRQMREKFQRVAEVG